MYMNLEKYLIVSTRVTDEKYQLYDVRTKKVISSLSYFIYPDVKGFNWINLANIETVPQYRRMGYMETLLKTALSDLDRKYPNMGQYLIVLFDNTPAVKLYTKLGFKVAKCIQAGTNRYLVMSRGNGDLDILKKQKLNLS